MRGIILSFHPDTQVLKDIGFVFPCRFAMDSSSLKRIAKATTKTLISYVTYQALHVVLDQLKETDPIQRFWLHQFAARESIQDGEVFLKALFQENPELGFRLLTVRSHIADELADFLPEMLRSGLEQANMEQRRQQLERMTQVDPTLSDLPLEQAADAADATES